MKNALLALAIAAAHTAPGLAQTTAAPVPAPTQTQPAQPGIRSLGVGAVTTVFHTVAPADMLASKLMNLDVYNLQNENIGEIEDLVIDNGKQIQAIIVSVGGFLGMGERYVAVKPGALMITSEADGTGTKVVANTTREQLRGAPAFKFDGRMARPADKANS
jgi:hypothetical protein